MSSLTHSRSAQNTVLGLCIIVIFLADFFSKKWVMTHIEMGEFIQVTSFFKLVYTVNRGVSFSMFSVSQSYGVYILLALTGVIAAFVLYLMIQSKILMERLSFAFVFAGAIGNIFDRMQIGGVVDFLYFHYNQYYWPAFNIADSCICVGVFLLFFYHFYVIKKSSIK